MTPRLPCIVVHGGAGTRQEADPRPHTEGVLRAARAGYEVLAGGGSALDAVCLAVRLLEDDPTFNAGAGACLTRDGTAELDASVMEGTRLRAGAVGAVRRVKNPVLLARAVMEKSEHLLLVDAGAERFAAEHGFELVENAALITETQRARLQEALAARAEERVASHMATVGAVAADARGHVATATSTGGMVGKMSGRIGDTPIIGAGTYADDLSGAASATGHGEAIVRVVMAKAACDRVAAGAEPMAAARASVHLLRDRAQSSGGIILVAADGRWGWAMNTPRMARAAVSPAGESSIIAAE
jgi:beta-aspartyl-peptidase (threonine type)